MVATAVTLNDLGGHSSVADFIKMQSVEHNTSVHHFTRF